MKKNERHWVIALVASISLTTFSCDGDALDTSALSNESQLTSSSVAGNIIKGDFFGEGDAAFQQEANEVLAELLGKITTDDEKHRYVKKYPDFYGGAYITDRGRLVVYIHGDFEEGVQQVKTYVNDRGITDYVSCDYSFQELTDIMNNMNDRFETLPKEIKQNIVMYYIKDDQNKVIVSLRNNSLGTISDFQKKVICHPAIVFDNEMQIGYSYSHANNRPSFSATLQPGGGFFVSSSSSNFNGSWAFRARKTNQTKYVGMVTASHVFHEYDSLYLGGNYLPNTHIDVYNAEADAAFVRIGNTPFDSIFISPLLFFYSNVLMEYPNQSLDTITIKNLSTQTSVPGCGTVINKRGMTTFHTTGVVQSTNYTDYYDNMLITNRMLASMISDEGDSGGIIYTYVSGSGIRYTVGVLSHTLTDSQTNICYGTVFSKADIVLNALNIQRY